MHQHQPKQPLTCFSCSHLTGTTCDITAPAINTALYGQQCQLIEYEPGTGPREFDDYAAYCQARPTPDVALTDGGAAQ